MSDTIQDEKGNLRITLRLHSAVVQVIDDLNAYIPQGERADMVRFLMNLGLKQLRLEQTAREQADVFRKLTSVMSEEFTQFAASIQHATEDRDQKTLPFEDPAAPAAPAAAKNTRTRKSSGPSSTGTKSQ